MKNLIIILFLIISSSIYAEGYADKLPISKNYLPQRDIVEFKATNDIYTENGIINKGTIVQGCVRGDIIVFEYHDAVYKTNPEFLEKIIISKNRSVNFEIKELINKRETAIATGWAFFAIGSAAVICAPLTINERHNSGFIGLMSAGSVCYIVSTIKFCQAASYQRKINDNIMLNSNINSISLVF